MGCWRGKRNLAGIRDPAGENPRKACNGPHDLRLDTIGGDAHLSAKTDYLFPWRAYLLPGSSGENAPCAAAPAGSSFPAELHALDVCGLQTFGAGFHFKADFRAFL
jgi:hypothetical protein